MPDVDYFSTLAYQPSIAFENAGLLAPFATVVLVTRFGALPVYRYVAGKSFAGQESIGMLARLVSGWPGKVLVPLGFAATAVFLYTFVDVVVGKPAGIKIAAWFIAAILVTSLASRVLRARELRFPGFHFPDPKSRLLWDAINHLDLSVLVPHRPGRRSLESKEATIRQKHRIPPEEMVVFVEVQLADPSDFAPTPELIVVQQEGRYILQVRNAASVAHTLAAVALELSKIGRPPTIHFGWTDESPVSGTLGFLLFGEGNVPWEVRELVLQAEPDPAKRPKVMIADS